MNLRFCDLEDETNPANGRVFVEEAPLLALLDDLASRPPFICEIVGDNGYKLQVGVGGVWCCVQYCSSNGEPPYLMATTRIGPSDEVGCEFLLGGTLTPVAKHQCLSPALMKDVVCYFHRTGQPSPAHTWEEV
jgi:hypothetical protein